MLAETPGGAALRTQQELSDRHWRVEVSGAPTLRSMLALIDTLHETYPGGQPLLLVFAEACESQDLTLEALVGEHIGVRLAHVPRIACTAPPLTLNTERVARRYGANLRVFASESLAIGWLLDGA